MRLDGGGPVPRRAIAFGAVAWTIACGAWVGSAALQGKLESGPVAAAVIGFVGVVWFIGTLIVSLFWIGRPPDDP